MRELGLGFGAGGINDDVDGTEWRGTESGLDRGVRDEEGVV